MFICFIVRVFLHFCCFANIRSVLYRREPFRLEVGEGCQAPLDTRVWDTGSFCRSQEATGVSEMIETGL